MFSVQSNAMKDGKLFNQNDFLLDNEMNTFRKNSRGEVERLVINVFKRNEYSVSKKFTNFKLMVNHFLGISRRVTKFQSYDITFGRHSLMTISINPNSAYFHIYDGYDADGITVLFKDGKYGMILESQNTSDFLNKMRTIFNSIVESKNKTKKGSTKTSVASMFEEKQNELFTDLGIRFDRKQVPYKHAMVYLKIIRDVATTLGKIVGKENLGCHSIIMDERRALGGYSTSYKGKVIRIKFEKIHPDSFKNEENFEKAYMKKCETLFHEFGHALEDYFYCKARGSVNPHTFFKDTMKEVMKDKNISKMISYLTDEKAHTIEEYIKTPQLKKSYADYLLEPTEVFARGFGQYMMYKTNRPFEKLPDYSFLSNFDVIEPLIQTMFTHIKATKPTVQLVR